MDPDPAPITAATPTPGGPTEPAPLRALPTVNRETVGWDRWWGAVLFLPSLALLLVAAGLTPDAEGYGTHTQLGLAPCGFEVATGLPCATCGMTTAFALAAEGRLIASFLVQPAGAALAVLTAMATLAGAWTLWSGMRITRLLAAAWTPRVLLAFIALVLAAWLYTASRRYWFG